MTSDMSAVAIEARLDALCGLHALGLSLADAGPPVPRRVFDNRSLFIQGRVSAGARGVVGLTAADERDVPLFMRHAGKSHMVGDEFELVVDPDGTSVIVATRCILVAVTQQFGRPWDEIPAGWKTIAVLRFVNGVPPEVSNLPERDTWDSDVSCRVITAADWRRKPR